MNLVIGAFTMGLILSLLSLGMLFSFRMIKFTDITVDGSITLGASVSALLITSGWSPWLATFIAFTAGSLAGSITGLLYTRFKIPEILSGILMMTALYSINLRIMGRSNIPLLDTKTISEIPETLLLKLNHGRSAMSVIGWQVSVVDLSVLASSLVICIFLAWLIYVFLGTHFGTALRATGNNVQMVRAQGINDKRMIVFTLALANGLVGLSGALLAQYQGFADVQMGVGMMVWGLASVIIGEAIINDNSIGFIITGAVVGSVLFRLLVAIALRWGLNPNDLKIITALFVFIALILPGLLKNKKLTFKRKTDVVP